MSESQAIIYCRVSEVRQVDNMSLGSQERLCREYVERQGWTVGKVFVEKGESASTTKRTELTRLLHHCISHKKQIVAVVVYAVDRFARDLHDYLMLRRNLAELGIVLRAVTQPFDESPAGSLTEQLLAAFAEFDNGLRRERTKVGMRAALKEGRWTFCAPLGYQIVNKEMVIDPKVGPLVRQAFEMVAREGRTLFEAACYLQNHGVRGDRGGKVAGATIKRSLVNPLYMGRVRVEKWGIDVQGKHTPLVSERLFKETQLALSGHAGVGERAGEASRPYRRLNPDFPLRTFLRCGSCGKCVTGSWSKSRSGKRYAYYRCHRCKAVNIAKKKLEEGFVEWLRSIRPSKADFALFEALVDEKYGKKVIEAKQERTRLRRRMTELDGKLERLTEAYLFESALPKDQYDVMRQKLEADKTVTEIELHNWNLERLDVEGILNFARQLLDNLDRLWIQLDVLDKKRLQTTLFPEGVTYLNGDFRTTASLFDFRRLAEAEGFACANQGEAATGDFRTGLSGSDSRELGGESAGDSGMVHP
jgi:DNA invertase Pin-like site-specific DNA recombinase/phage FluMu protein Com